jgi:hydrogenase nickel incorporation protein HypA/HybF
MHEVSVVQSILDIATKKARECGSGRVLKIAMKVGEMTCINDENLTFVFDVMKKGTPANDASMVIERIPVKAQCNACQTVFAVSEYRFICDACGSPRVTVTEGNNITVESLEVE